MTTTASRYAIVAEDDPATRYRIDDEHTGTVARHHDEEARGLTLRRARAVRSELVVPPAPMTTTSTAPETATITVGTDHDGERTRVTIELRPTPGTWQTTDHSGPVTDPLCLAITGTTSYATGQIAEDIAEQIADGRITSPLDPDDLASLLSLWRRWHLNTLRAGCLHQEDIPHTWDEAGDAAADAETTTCPHGYRYGSAWLTETLPAEVLAEVRRLMTLAR